MHFCREPDALFAAMRQFESRIAQIPGRARGLREVRAWQTARLLKRYEDLHHDTRYRAAVEFFTTDLYGPQDFSRRNGDLARAWALLRRGLPAEVLDVLTNALELEVLTLELDDAMAEHMGSSPMNDSSYANAWQCVGKAEMRARQIELLITVGSGLGRLANQPSISLLLRAARLPAHFTGFGALQDFLERGFAALRKLDELQDLLNIIRARES
ncbi:MAG TPA: hypothetical protein VI653_10935 [Steroidobacteraceae bacterium]